MSSASNSRRGRNSYPSRGTSLSQSSRRVLRERAPSLKPWVRCSGEFNADLLLAVRRGVGVEAAVALVLAVAAVDPVGEAVAMQAVVASIAEQIVVAACTAGVGATVVADDLGIVPGAPRDLVVPALAADHGREQEPMVVANQADIVPLAPSDLVVAVRTADLLVSAAAPDYEVGGLAAVDRVVPAVAAHEAHGTALVVTPYRVQSRAAYYRVVPAVA